MINRANELIEKIEAETKELYSLIESSKQLLKGVKDENWTE